MEKTKTYVYFVVVILSCLILKLMTVAEVLHERF